MNDTDSKVAIIASILCLVTFLLVSWVFLDDTKIRVVIMAFILTSAFLGYVTRSML